MVQAGTEAEQRGSSKHCSRLPRRRAGGVRERGSSLGFRSGSKGVGRSGGAERREWWRSRELRGREGRASGVVSEACQEERKAQGLTWIVGVETSSPQRSHSSLFPIPLSHRTRHRLLVPVRRRRQRSSPGRGGRFARSQVARRKGVKLLDDVGPVGRVLSVGGRRRWRGVGSRVQDGGGAGPGG